MGVRELMDRLDWGPAPESDELAKALLAERGRDNGMYIDGRWVQPRRGERFDTVNPATGEVLGTIGQADSHEIDLAVAAARHAQPAWEALSGHDRARHLYAIGRAVQRNSRILAVLETMDNGKPIRETRDIDIPLVARHFIHHAGWAQLLDETMPNQKPWGVCGQIIPWNFPLLMLAWKVAPALAAGNTIVIKPAESTSLTALAFAALCHDAGLPRGVLNIVTGDGKTGALIVEHDDIDKIAFTGSTAVGRVIRKATAGSGKGLTLELGGKSPFIVFEDADVESAIEGLVDAIWFNQGQVCCAGSRLLVQESIAEPFYERLRERMAALRVGNPLDKAVDMGAIIDANQLTTIEKLCETGVEEGGTLWQPNIEMPETGNFFPPTLFTDVSPASTVVQEEIFGPVLVSMTFRSPGEAVSLANNTKFGLAGSVWSQDIDTALEVARRIKAGVIWVNCTNRFDANAGFGGYRESGFGREGGHEGMSAYLRPPRTTESELTESKENDANEIDEEGYAVIGVREPTTVLTGIDRTAKMFIGGVQKRPDGGNSLTVMGPSGRIDEVGRGNRKDIRNAVEAAIGRCKWPNMNGHQRAQVLYYIGENLEARRNEFIHRLVKMTGLSDASAETEFDDSVEQWFRWAAWADKYDGRVHETNSRALVIAVNEPIGVVGVIASDSRPLAGFVRLVAPLLAMGNTVVAIPSEAHPLVATDLYQVLETSDLPNGALNIITGLRADLIEPLAAHDAVDAIWVASDDITLAQTMSAGNMKRTWDANPDASDIERLRQSSQVKNIWLPHAI